MIGKTVLSTVNILLFLCLMTFISCDSPSDSDHTPPNLQIQIEPNKAGTVQVDGKYANAQAKRGSVFLYWKITSAQGKFSTQIDDSITVNRDSVRSITAVFGSTHLDVPVHLKASGDHQFAYFVKHFEMPEDSLNSQSYSAVYKADLLEQTKEKVFVTAHKIHFFDVSYNGDYLSFSTVSQRGNALYDMYTGNIKTGEAFYAGTGSKSRWANHSNKFLMGSENKLCIYVVRSNRCYNLPVESTYHQGFWAAAWSPDDRHILVSRTSDSFFLYEVETKKRTKIPSNHIKEYFTWLDNKTFLTSGAPVENIKNKVLKYSTVNLAPVDTLPFTATYNVNASPSKSKLVYINDGVNIYGLSGEQSNNILNYHKWTPKFPIWMGNNQILFYNRQDSSPYILYLSGEVFQL